MSKPLVLIDKITNSKPKELKCVFMSLILLSAEIIGGWVLKSSGIQIHLRKWEPRLLYNSIRYRHWITTFKICEIQETNICSYEVQAGKC